MGKLPRVIAFALGLWTWALCALAGPADVPVLFTNAPVTSFGTSVFVVGSIPQLGNWDVTRSTKLVPTGCVGQTCQWYVNIGIPAGTSYQYAFIQRADCATCYSNAANVSKLPAPTNSAAVASGPPAPWNGKTVFYYSSWSNVSLLYSNLTFGWTNEPMTAIGPGRTNLFPSEKLWRADGANHAGDTNLHFLFYTVVAGTNVYDNAGLPGIDYQSPLDACVVQDGQVYNYWPPPFVGTNRVVTFSMTPTNGLATRTIRVYLPRGFSENPTKLYPVLYMHDGQNLFLGMTGLSGYSWGADTNAATLIRFGRMRETIIVGVDNSSDRFCEYAPPTCSYSQCSTPRGDKYVSFLADQLKPYIDNTYSITAGRTLTDADDTGALGSSLGGLISAYMAWQRSATYHKIGCMSSSFDICEPITAATNFPLRVYLDSGNFDSQGTVGSSDDLTYTVGERDNLINDGHVFNIDLDHTIGYGQWHSEQWWAVRLPRCFAFLFPTSDEPDTVLDAATPPQITNLQLSGPSNVVTWTSFHLRTYTVQGAMDTEYSSSMTWSDLYTTSSPEPLPWSYPSAGVSNTFHFLRVREQGVPNWPN
jgi:enterochelin esterase-like enzyme